MATFSAPLQLNGKTATGIEVPDTVMAELGEGKRPPVVVEVSGYVYRTTIGAVDGRPMIPVSAEHRDAAGISAGDQLTVTLTLDDAPRTVEVPADLAEALAASPAAAAAFESLPPSGKKRHVLSVTGAKTEETRRRRVAKAIADLEAGKR